MMILLPHWVGDMHKDLEDAIDEIAYDYGVDSNFVKDSSSIKASISNIVSNMQYTIEHQRVGLQPRWWYEDRKFGAKREKSNAEEKKIERNRNRRSKSKEKKEIVKKR